MGCHLAYTEAINLIHMTTTLRAQQHQHVCTDAVAVHAVLAKGNEEIYSYPLVEFQGHTYKCTYTHIHPDKAWFNHPLQPLAWTLTLT